MNRLVVVSSRAPLCASVPRVVRSSVCVVRYDYERASLQEISELVKARLGGYRVKSIALLFHCDRNSFFLTLDGGKELNVETSKNDYEVQQLLIDLASHLDKGEGFHLFNNPRDLNVRALTAQLNQLLARPVELVSDLFGPVSQQNITEMYFNVEELKKLLYLPDSKAMPLDRYEKIRTVGKGAFGTAVLYRQAASGQLVVIKEINMLELSTNERQMAFNEVQVLSSLHHPNIIRYLGSFEEDGVLRIEMEYADGGTLAQLIGRSSRLSEREVLALFRQCVAAIRYMHQNHILHRDLKTANVFLTKERLIKVGDFGISKVMSTKGQAQTVLGTPYYISPEMCEGKQYDHKSDVWALGCILYEMACLQKTFQGENLPVLVNKIMKGTFDPVPNVYSEGLRNLVSDLLQKDPAIRPTAAETYSRACLILEQVKVSETQKTGNQKRVRSVLYQLSGSGPTFSCIPVSLPAMLKITQVCVSYTHYIAVSSDKTVYSWGEGKRGQLGHNEMPLWLQQPTRVETLDGKNICSAAAGDGFSIFLSDSGVIFTCGDGTFGCLGHGDWDNVSKPQVVECLMGVEIRQIASGENHCVALAASGEVFAWGRGESGRLGTGSELDCCVPTIVTIPNSIISTVHCGPDCTAVITVTGTVFACGSNAHNKLGISSSFLKILSFDRIITSHSLTFREVHSLSRWIITSISLAINHSAALTRCGRVVTMGSSNENQTGHSETSPHLVKAVEVQIATCVECGPTYTVMGSIHNALYFWGTRYLGTGKTDDALSLKVEVVTKPQAVLALYASPSQVAKGEFIALSSIQTLWDTVLILVNTTVALARHSPSQRHATDQQEFDSIGPVPRWITAELAQAEHDWEVTSERMK